jgi:putative membrane protein
MGGMGWMWLWWLLVLGGVVALVVGLVRAGRSGNGPPARPPSARQILDERFARGDIDEEDYRRRRREIDGL